MTKTQDERKSPLRDHNAKAVSDYCKKELFKIADVFSPFHQMADEYREKILGRCQKPRPMMQNREFMLWFAYMYGVQKTEALAKKFELQASPGYYADKRKFYRQLSQAAMKVVAEISKVKSRSQRNIDLTNKNPIVKRCSRGLREIVTHLLGTRDEIEKLWVCDLITHNGCLVTGANARVYSWTFETYAKNARLRRKYPSAAAYYFRTADVGAIRERLVKKYGQSGFDFRWKFVSDVYAAGFRVLLAGHGLNGVKDCFVESREFFYLIASLDRDRANELIKEIPHESGKYVWDGFFGVPNAKCNMLSESDVSTGMEVFGFKRQVCEVGGLDANGEAA